MSGDLELLQKIVKTINKTPQPLRQRALSLVMGRMVPYVGTSQLVIEEMTEERVVVIAKNLRPIRNHIGQVHAAAMALAAETASGFVTAMNMPRGTLPLITTLKVDYRKRTRGDIRAVATLSPEQREAIRSTEKGSVDVTVHAMDQTGEEPIECQAVWAWIPRKRR